MILIMVNQSMHSLLVPNDRCADNYSSIFDHLYDHCDFDHPSDIATGRECIHYKTSEFAKDLATSLWDKGS